MKEDNAGSWFAEQTIVNLLTFLSPATLQQILTVCAHGSVAICAIFGIETAVGLALRISIIGNKCLIDFLSDPSRAATAVN